MYEVWEFSNAAQYRPGNGVVAIHVGLTEEEAYAKVDSIHKGKRYIHPHWATIREAE